MILAIKTEKIGNLVLNLATRCQQPYILVEGESFHWTNCTYLNFNRFWNPVEIIKVGNTMNSNGGQTLPHWVLMKKKSWLFSIFFHTWSEPDKLLHFYFCRWHGTKRRYDDHEKGMLLLLLLGMQEKILQKKMAAFWDSYEKNYRIRDPTFMQTI